MAITLGSMKFTGVVSVVGWTGTENLLEGAEGNASTLTTNDEFQLRLPNLPCSIVSDATIVGIRYTFTVKVNSGSITIYTTPKVGATISGNLQSTTVTSTTGQSFFKGSSSNLLGLSSSQLTPSTLNNFRIKVQAGTTGGNALSITGTSTVPNIIFYYTLPYSNQVYNTSGKLSITSGKVSIT